MTLIPAAFTLLRVQQQPPVECGQYRSAQSVACTDGRPPAGFSNATVAVTATLMGIRETRRIIGDYVLTGDDHRARRRFKDEISLGSFFRYPSVGVAAAIAVKQHAGNVRAVNTVALRARLRQHGAFLPDLQKR